MSKKIDVAVQSNTLIALDRYNWTLQEQKIFLLLVSKIDSIREENFRTIEFTVDEFAKLIGLKEKGSIYTELEKITELKRFTQTQSPTGLLINSAIQSFV